MRSSSLSRQTLVCRLIAIWFVATGSSAFAADRVSGVVVDQSGQPLPRAFVRVTGSSGGVFTNERGQFDVAVTAVATCHIEASLAGFAMASAPCKNDPLQLVLPVAPVEETMVVSATRTEAPVSQVGASATVFTLSDLEERQKPQLADLLVSTPGAMIVRNGQPGALTSLFVRGGESDYNKVLLDGVPLNEPGGTFYFSTLTTENLERVEVIRGAYSSLFGSDAMGSVIQLFTKRADRSARRPRVSGQVDGGTYGTVHTTGGVSGAAGRFDYSVAAARFDTDNRVPNSAFTNTTFSASAGVSLTSTTSLRTLARTERGTAGTPGPTAYGRPDLDAFSKRDDGVFSVTLEDQRDRVRQRATYSRAGSTQQSTNLNVDPPFRATFGGRIATRLSTDFRNDSLTTLTRHHAGYQADMRLATSETAGDHVLTVLADWDGERSDVNNRLSATQTKNQRDNFGFSAQDQILWPRVYVTVGGRVERNDSFGTALVPRGTIVYVVHEPSGSVGETLLKASAGVGIKEPTMLESFSPSPFFHGNPDLEPERSRSVEFGVTQRLAGDRAKLELTYFDNRFRDVISLVTTNPATFEAQYQNIGLTRARGVEVAAQSRPASFVSLRAAYTLLDTKIIASERPDDVLFGLGRPAVRRPKHSGFVGASAVWKRASVDINGAFIGSFADSDFGLFNPSFTESPGHQSWDLRTTLRVTRQLTALLAVDNLTNEDYSEPIGYQPLLRAVRIGVRVGF